MRDTQKDVTVLDYPNDVLLKDLHKKLSLDFFDRSKFFYGAWLMSAPVVWGHNHQPVKFSEWFEHVSEENELDDQNVYREKEFVISKHMDLAKKMQNITQVFEDPIKNLAFGDLYSAIDDREVFWVGEALKDHKEFNTVSVLYMSLAVLYENYDETIAFIKNEDPYANPYYLLEGMRDDLSVSGDQAIGYWYANSQEVRGFVDSTKKMRAGNSAGGHKKAAPYRLKKEHWQSIASKIWQAHPSYTISKVASIIEERTGDLWETIRKNIKKKQT